ncbi:x 8e-14 Predicted protein [Diplonema papillatum]|nr:x 8e-14 Predicted protein [Diplonema papillatum]
MTRVHHRGAYGTVDVDSWECLNAHVATNTCPEVRSLTLYQLIVTEKQWKWLASVMRHLLRYMVELDLSSVDMDDSACSTVCRGLEAGAVRLRVMRLCGNNLGSASGTSIGHYVASLSGTSLEKLVLRYNKLGTNGSAALLKKLANHPSLTHLDLSSNALVADANAVSEAVQALVFSCNTLRIVHLSGNDIGDTGIRRLAPFLMHKQANHLVCLDLWNCNLGPSSGSVLGAAVASSRTLTDLKLGGNQLSDEGIIDLIAGLVTPQEGTRMGRTSVMNRRSSALGDFNRLTSFHENVCSYLPGASAARLANLSEDGEVNEFGRVDSALAGLAPPQTMRGCRLASLDISANLCGDASAAAIVTLIEATASPHNKTRSLNLRDNQYTLASCLAFINAAASVAHKVLNRSTSPHTRISPSLCKRADLRLVNISRNHLTQTDCDLLYVACRTQPIPSELESEAARGTSGLAFCSITFSPFDSDEQYTQYSYQPVNTLDALLTAVDRLDMAAAEEWRRDCGPDYASYRSPHGEKQTELVAMFGKHHSRGDPFFRHDSAAEVSTSEPPLHRRDLSGPDDCRAQSFDMPSHRVRSPSEYIVSPPTPYERQRVTSSREGTELLQGRKPPGTVNKQYSPSDDERYSPMRQLEGNTFQSAALSKKQRQASAGRHTSSNPRSSPSGNSVFRDHVSLKELMKDAGRQHTTGTENNEGLLSRRSSTDSFRVHTFLDSEAGGTERVLFATDAGKHKKHDFMQGTAAQLQTPGSDLRAAGDSFECLAAAVREFDPKRYQKHDLDVEDLATNGDECPAPVDEPNPAYNAVRQAATGLERILHEGDGMTQANSESVPARDGSEAVDEMRYSSGRHPPPNSVAETNRAFSLSPGAASDLGKVPKRSPSPQNEASGTPRQLPPGLSQKARDAALLLGFCDSSMDARLGDRLDHSYPASAHREDLNRVVDQTAHEDDVPEYRQIVKSMPPANRGSLGEPSEVHLNAPHPEPDLALHPDLLRMHVHAVLASTHDKGSDSDAPEILQMSELLSSYNNRSTPAMMASAPPPEHSEAQSFVSYANDDTYDGQQHERTAARAMEALADGVDILSVATPPPSVHRVPDGPGPEETADQEEGLPSSPANDHFEENDSGPPQEEDKQEHSIPDEGHRRLALNLSVGSCTSNVETQTVDVSRFDKSAADTETQTVPPSQTFVDSSCSPIAEALLQPGQSSQRVASPDLIHAHPQLSSRTSPASYASAVQLVPIHHPVTPTTRNDPHPHPLDESSQPSGPKTVHSLSTFPVEAGNTPSPEKCGDQHSFLKRPAISPHLAHDFNESATPTSVIISPATTINSRTDKNQSDSPMDNDSTHAPVLTPHGVVHLQQDTARRAGAGAHSSPVTDILPAAEIIQVKSEEVNIDEGPVTPTPQAHTGDHNSPQSFSVSPTTSYKNTPQNDTRHEQHTTTSTVSPSVHRTLQEQDTHISAAATLAATPGDAFHSLTSLDETETSVSRLDGLQELRIEDDQTQLKGEPGPGRTAHKNHSPAPAPATNASGTNECDTNADGKIRDESPTKSPSVTFGGAAPKTAFFDDSVKTSTSDRVPEFVAGDTNRDTAASISTASPPKGSESGSRALDFTDFALASPSHGSVVHSPRDTPDLTKRLGRESPSSGGSPRGVDTGTQSVQDVSPQTIQDAVPRFSGSLESQSPLQNPRSPKLKDEADVSAYSQVNETVPVNEDEIRVVGEVAYEIPEEGERHNLRSRQSSSAGSPSSGPVPATFLVPPLDVTLDTLSQVNAAESCGERGDDSILHEAQMLDDADLSDRGGNSEHRSKHFGFETSEDSASGDEADGHVHRLLQRQASAFTALPSPACLKKGVTTPRAQVQLLQLRGVSIKIQGLPALRPPRRMESQAVPQLSNPLPQLGKAYFPTPPRSPHPYLSKANQHFDEAEQPSTAPPDSEAPVNTPQPDISSPHFAIESCPACTLPAPHTSPGSIVLTSVQIRVLGLPHLRKPDDISTRVPQLFDPHFGNSDGHAVPTVLPDCTEDKPPQNVVVPTVEHTDFLQGRLFWGGEVPPDEQARIVADLIDKRNRQLDAAMLQESTAILKDQHIEQVKTDRSVIVSQCVLKPDGPARVKIVFEKKQFTVFKAKKRFRKSKLLHCVPALYTTTPESLVRCEGTDLFVWNVYLDEAQKPKAGWISVATQNVDQAANAASELVACLRFAIEERQKRATQDVTQFLHDRDAKISAARHSSQAAATSAQNMIISQTPE